MTLLTISVWYSCLLFFGQRIRGFQVHRYPFFRVQQHYRSLQESDRGLSEQEIIPSLIESLSGCPSREEDRRSKLEQTSSIKRISRRQIFSSAALAIGTNCIGIPIEPSLALPWQATPVNKRTGVTVFDAESTGYTVSFVTYLSRFLLTFDASCQRWWYDQVRTVTSNPVLFL